MTIDEGFVPPLMSDKPAALLKVVRSVWKYETTGCNWAKNEEPRMQLLQSEYNALAHHRYGADALLLLSKIRFEHSVRRGPFALAPNAMVVAQTIPGWGWRRYTNARSALIEIGFLRQVHSGGSGTGDPNRYELAKPPISLLYQNGAEYN